MLTESESWHSNETNKGMKMKMETNQLKFNTYINYWKMNYIHVLLVIVNRIDKALKKQDKKIAEINAKRNC